MMSMDELQEVISSLSRAEKAQVLQWVARDLSEAVPGIEHTPDVLGGKARIVRTRIPVWTIEQARRFGMSEAKILENFPTLRAEDLENAWTYARLHPEEIDRDILENETA